MRQFFTTPSPPNSIVERRAIDLSIQFLLFWTPLVTLLGWWLDKPLSLLFDECRLTFALTFFFLMQNVVDLFLVTLLVRTCFLVNYVTADAKTNWAEDSVLVSFYIMIIHPPLLLSIS